MTRPWLLVGIVIPIVGCSQEPDNYEDCVLQHVKDSGESRAAVVTVRQMCREKFPKQVKLTPVPYDPWEVEKVEDAPQFDEDDFEIVDRPE